jgi:hypothetical protein
MNESDMPPLDEDECEQLLPQQMCDISEDDDAQLHLQCERDRAYAKQAQAELDAFYRDLSVANKKKRANRTSEDVLTNGLRAVLRKIKLIDADADYLYHAILQDENIAIQDRTLIMDQFREIWKWIKIILGTLGAVVLVSAIMWAIIIYRAFA